MIFVWLRVTLLIGAGYWSLQWLARNQDDPFAGWCLTGSFLVRAALAVGLYCISFYHWPILQSLQLQTEPGFWMFGLDCPGYDRYAGRILDAWALGTELPNPGLGLEYYLMVALVYLGVGRHPLFAAIVNCWLAAMTGLLAYFIARRLLDRRAAKTAGLLVSFWPSSLIWPTQLLKDALSWFLIFATLALLVLLLSQRDQRSRLRARDLLSLAGLGLLVFCMTRLRGYVGFTLCLAALAMTVPLLVRALFQRQPAMALRASALGAIVLFSMLLARAVDTRAIISPAHPDQAHFRLAYEYWSHGNSDRALEHYWAAIHLNPRAPEPYLGIATIKVEQECFNEASTFYTQYLQHEQDSQKRQAVVKRLIRLLEAQGSARASSRVSASAPRTPVIPAATEGPPASRQLPASVPAGSSARTDRSFALAVATTATVSRRPESIQDSVGTTPVILAATKRPPSPIPALASTPVTLKPGPAVAVMTPSGLEERHSRVSARTDQTAIPTNPDHITRDGAVRDPHVTDTSAIAEPNDDATIRRESIRRLALQAFPKDQTIQLQTGIDTSGAGDTGDPWIHSRSTIFEGRDTPHLDWLATGLEQLDDQAIQSTREITPEYLETRRQGFVASGGYSLVDAWAQINTPEKLVRYLPRGLAIGVLAPFPRQWFDIGGSTGIMRALASIEMILLYLLIPAIVAGSVLILRRQPIAGGLLMIYIALSAVSMSLVIANLGTLFRLRLQFVLVMLIIAAAGNPFGLYATWLSRARRFLTGFGSTSPDQTAPAMHPVEVGTSSGDSVHASD